jgi:hypothetical protein
MRLPCPCARKWPAFPLRLCVCFAGLRVVDPAGADGAACWPGVVCCPGLVCWAGVEPGPSAPPGPNGPVGPRLSTEVPHGRLLLEPVGPEDPSGPSGPVGPTLGIPGNKPWFTLQDRPGNVDEVGLGVLGVAATDEATGPVAAIAHVIPATVPRRLSDGVIWYSFVTRGGIGGPTKAVVRQTRRSVC